MLGDEDEAGLVAQRRVVDQRRVQDDAPQQVILDKPINLGIAFAGGVEGGRHQGIVGKDADADGPALVRQTLSPGPGLQLRRHGDTDFGAQISRRLTGKSDAEGRLPGGGRGGVDGGGHGAALSKAIVTRQE